MSGGCEWNPERNGPAWQNDEHHFTTRAVFSLGRKENWHLCGPCSELPRFKRFRHYRSLMDRPFSSRDRIRLPFRQNCPFCGLFLYQEKENRRGMCEGCRVDLDEKASRLIRAKWTVEEQEIAHRSTLLMTQEMEGRAAALRIREQLHEELLRPACPWPMVFTASLDVMAPSTIDRLKFSFERFPEGGKVSVVLPLSWWTAWERNSGRLA